ncbi:MAG: DNA repair protein RecO C-terminal domain-containing protein [Bacteroidia bacterium]|nr:DNA repair protein RecO C-terminal domain-containing protein [Bacteroidia bacterium]
MNTELIVLNLTKLGETSIVLHTLSRDYGRKSFVIKVSRKTSMSLFLPLNILEADVQENNKSTLWRAGSASARYPLAGIRSNIYKNTMTLFMSEVLYRTIKEGANEEGLYDWCARSILTLDAITSDFSNFHIRFLLELAVVLGFSPSADDLAPFAGQWFPVLKEFVSLPFAESMLLPLNGESRNAIAEVLLKYISHHTECAINVQSLKVLRELYR